MKLFGILGIGAGFAFSAGMASGATVTGYGSVVVNSFLTNTTATSDVSGSPLNLVNRRTNNNANDNRMTSATATSGFEQFDKTGGTTFTAGTIITNQGVFPGFDNPLPFTVKLDGVNVAGAPGLVGTHRFITTTLPTVAAYTTLRMDTALSKYMGAGNFLSDLDELVIFPDRMEKLAYTVPSKSGAQDPTVMYDGKGRVEAGGWYDSGGASKFFVMDFGGPKNLSALLFNNWDNTGADFDIQIPDGLGGWTSIVTATTANQEVLAMQFTNYINVSQLRIDFGSNESVVGFTELIALALVPEPGALCMLGIVLPLLARRRR